MNKQNTKAVIIDFIKTNRTELVAFLKQNKITSLERFVQAGKAYKLDNIIRICSDNPFLETKYTVLPSA